MDDTLIKSDVCWPYSLYSFVAAAAVATKYHQSNPVVNYLISIDLLVFAAVVHFLRIQDVHNVLVQSVLVEFESRRRAEDVVRWARRAITQWRRLRLLVDVTIPPWYLF